MPQTINSHRWFEADWVKIKTYRGLCFTTMDVANHPLNEEKSGCNLNTLATYYRYPTYPFWISHRALNSYFTEQDEFEDIETFLYCMGPGSADHYRRFCRLWDYLQDRDRKLDLLELSKNL